MSKVGSAALAAALGLAVLAAILVLLHLRPLSLASIQGEWRVDDDAASEAETGPVATAWKGIHLRIAGDRIAVERDAVVLRTSTAHVERANAESLRVRFDDGTTWALLRQDAHLLLFTGGAAGTVRLSAVGAEP